MSDHAGAPDSAREPGPWPSVSVVIPVLDEERHLAQAVGRVLAQEYAGPLEVILAVGPSRDATQEVAARLAASDERVRWVPNPSGRTPDALNAGIAEAKHEIVVRVDGHAELSDGYIATAVAELRRVGADNVGGIMDARGVTDFEKAVACAMRSKIGVGNARFHVGGTPGEADTVYLGVFRRATLTAVGGYDSHFARAQDWELNHRIRARGGLVWFTPDLKVTYRPRPNVAALARQYLNYGRWRRVVAATHEGTINLRYLAPPAMVVATSAATLLGCVSSRARTALVVPAAYVVGVTAGGWASSRDESVAVRARLPLVLAVMHWSWGVGFLTSPRKLRARAQGPTKAAASGPPSAGLFRPAGSGGVTADGSACDTADGAGGGGVVGENASS